MVNYLIVLYYILLAMSRVYVLQVKWKLGDEWVDVARGSKEWCLKAAEVYKETYRKMRIVRVEKEL